MSRGEKKDMLKKIIAGALAACMLTFPFIAGNGAEIDDLKQQQQELEEKSQEYERILADTKADIAKQEEYNQALLGKINVVNEEISLSREKITNLDAEIVQKSKEISQANQDIEAGMDKLRDRLRTIYMTGDVSTVEIILGAKDFSDFLDKLQLVKTMSNYDNNIINEIKDQLVNISNQKQDLEQAREELAQEEETLKERQTEYESLLKENQQVLQTLYSKSDEASLIISQYDQDMSSVKDEIADYYEEQRLLEEERQRQEEEEERNNNTNSGSNSGGNSGGTAITPPSSGGYIWPCPGFYYLTSQWNEDRGSYNHGAIDISGSGIMWTNVVAAASGTVITASNTCSHNYGKYGSCGCGGGYGNYVWIDHGNGKATVYAHFSSLTVSQGETVSAGQLLGYVGSTGESTGAHLHFETRYYGVRYNPMSEY